MSSEKKIVDLLIAVGDTPGKKDKENLLKTLDGFTPEDVEMLKSVISYAYDTVKYTYGVKMFTISNSDGELGWDAVVSLLEQLNNGLSGDNAQRAILNLTEQLSEDARLLLIRVIGRDLRCGMGPKSFSKIFGKGVISVAPYMRCTSFSAKALKKIHFPCVAQVKADGRFVNIIVRKDSVTLMSRNGEDCSNLMSNRMKSALMSVSNRNDTEFVMHGEVLATDDAGIPLPRDVGNGYLNSGDVDHSLVTFELWDVVDHKSFTNGACPQPYVVRLNVLRTILLKYHEELQSSGRRQMVLIDSYHCKNSQDLSDAFRKVREKGMEGLVVKNTDGIWKDGTSSDQVKMKVVAEGEVLVTGFTEGKGKYVGKVGALTTVSSCGKVKTNVAGLTDKQRKEYFDNPELIVGKVITVAYNDVTQDRRTLDYALYLPRMMEVRTDKEQADDLETLTAQIESFTDITSLIG